MNTYGKIYSGLMIPITENGKEVLYVTNASMEIIASCFNTSDTVEEFLEEVELTGYKINVFYPTVQCNFDKK